MEKVSNPSVADISQILEKEMEQHGYSAFCIRATHLLSKQLSFFMEQHRMETYSSSVGEMFRENYCHHHIGERQLICVKLFITRLNSIFNREGFVFRRRLIVPVELPANLDKLLFVYKEHCSEKGNCVATIQRNEHYCRSFLKLLADDGICDSDGITSATVSAAILRVTSVRALPAIRTFLRFLAENKYLECDYSFLVLRVRPSQPIPSVYSVEEIQRIESQVQYDAINGITSIGKRDYAMLLMATRLGLRPCDIVSLRFSELDFQAEAIRIVQEKTDTPLELPMLPVIRDALLDYINHARGDHPSQYVFLSMQPPYSHVSTGTFSRKFLKFLRFKNIPVYIPPSLKCQDNYVPYLFSDDEARRIFEAADSLQLSYNAKSNVELPMLLRMLYSCGFRLSELLAVRVGDINFERGFVLLKTTKGQKQRIVPFGDALTEMLNRYCLAMDLMGSPENYIFPGRSKGTHLSRCWTEMLFRTLLQNIGIYTRSHGQSRGPCLHCFRHLFAIKSFAQAERAGRPVNDSIPFLSIYMGHTDLTETEKYLKFSSDMFPENTELFEAYTDGIFPEVPYED